MRTAARMALVLTGTAILGAVMATSGARADRGLTRGEHSWNRMTLPQSASAQARPDRIDYVQAGAEMSIATAIARPSPAPGVANSRHGADRMENALAWTAMHKAENRSISWPGGCNGDTFAIQEIKPSDGGRGVITDRASAAAGDHIACSGKTSPDHRMRRADIGDSPQVSAEQPDSAPIVIRFKAEININLAALGW